MKNAKKILVIDDDLDFNDGVKALLRSANYNVATAKDPNEGEEKVLSEKPDLILLDIMMDSLFDGYSLCHKIKTSEKFKAYRNTPIIFVSAVKEKSGSRFHFHGEEQGLVGPDDYIDKPVKPLELIDHIERLLKE